MLNVTYCKAIFDGLRRRGLSAVDIATMTQLREDEIPQICAGESGFSDAVLSLIEHASGMTGGQLAALGTEPEGGELTRLSNIWGDVKEVLAPSSLPAGKPR